MKEHASQLKVQQAEDFAKLINEYPVVGLIDLRGLPANPLQKIKNEIKSDAIIRVVKKSVLKKALEKTDKKQLIEYLDIQPALLLTKENPFKVYNMINRKKTNMAAKPGQIPESDIEVKAGSTELMPGPAITALTKVGVPAKVEGGKIAVIKDKVVCKAGEAISTDLSSALTMLGMKPMKVGINVYAIFEKGVVYKKDVLFIDSDKTMNDLISAVQAAFNLSVNAGIVTRDNVEVILQKAFREARSLCLHAGVVSKDVIGDLLAKAVAEMKAIEEKTGKIEAN